MTLSPESFNKRSPVYRKLAGATFETKNDSVQAANMGNDSKEQLQKAGLIDLSLTPDTGIRGPKAVAYLEQQGLPVPEKPNLAVANADNHWVLRLSQSEHWILSDPLNADAQVPDIAQAEHGCYPVYCENSRSWFALTGQHRADVMAKVCGVDLREEAFPLGAIAQTSLARVNAVIVHHTIGNQDFFSIFSDSTSAEYLWESLLDAMGEFDGGALGVGSLKS